MEWGEWYTAMQWEWRTKLQGCPSNHEHCFSSAVQVSLELTIFLTQHLKFWDCRAELVNLYLACEHSFQMEKKKDRDMNVCLGITQYDCGLIFLPLLQN